MGYDPFDYFDLGEFDQSGGVETWFGSKADLVALVEAAHARGMQVYADAVYNHMSGGELEYNPDFRREGWTRFTPASGRYEFDYACFHPSRFQRVDGEAWGGMADLCHRNPLVYDAIMAHANMLITEIGFDGFRFDFVKGYGAWMIRSIHERQYVRGRRLVFPFGVGESWSSDRRDRRLAGRDQPLHDNPISRVRLSAALSAEGSVRQLRLFAAAVWRRAARWRRSGPIAPSPSSTTTTSAAATRARSSTTS